MGVTNEARAAQRSGDFEVDIWVEAKLEPMTKLWQGIGGHSNFFFSEEDARDASGAYQGHRSLEFAQTLWRRAQVRPHRARGFRMGIQEFVVNLPVVVAMGACIANHRLGEGTCLQYYIPGWEEFLFTTGRRHRFPRESYDSVDFGRA